MQINVVISESLDPSKIDLSRPFLGVTMNTNYKNTIAVVSSGTLGSYVAYKNETDYFGKPSRKKIVGGELEFTTASTSNNKMTRLGMAVNCTQQ